MKIRFRVNGKDYLLDGIVAKRLVDILRDTLCLTGTKECCGVGECGACTVLMDGLAVNACLILGSQLEGKEITTIEGLKQNGEYDYLQKLFVESGAVQCGYCTPGMILSAKALLMKNPHPGEKEIRQALEGNLCRCTGYGKIVEAVKKGGV